MFNIMTTSLLELSLPFNLSANSVNTTRLKPNFQDQKRSFCQSDIKRSTSSDTLSDLIIGERLERAQGLMSNMFYALSFKNIAFLIFLSSDALQGKNSSFVFLLIHMSTNI